MYGVNKMRKFKIKGIDIQEKGFFVFGTFNKEPVKYVPDCDYDNIS